MRMVEVFGANVRRVRQERGITLEALAHDVSLSYTYMGQIERGQRNPTLDVVAQALKTDALRLLGCERDSPP